MAARHGRFASITVNSKDLSTYADNLDLSIDVDTSDTSTFGVLWKTAIAGLIGATLSLSGNYDPTVTDGPADVLMACILAGVPVPVVHKPGGTASGQRTNSFNALITNYTEGSPVGDKVTFSASVLVTGAITPTTQS